ncbi:hypothetical protein QN277_016587 [Acacia crassicarpa]|uniref:DDE Tnp4 domain-containing protein n=1 Tax=Acacia crassicarpa TaxID=499986 RepID=A0AAE1MWY7_9FABA|nr:hypothetical protein QN277_016587 [Acacia crassicarpa]
MEPRRREVVGLMAGCLALLLAMRSMVVAMIVAVGVGRPRHLPDRTFRLDFHTKRANLRAMIYSSDTTCFNQIRMYRATFDKLCHMLDTIGGLRATRHMLVDEQVAMFLHILAHHVKNRVIQFEFGRSGETISRYFKLVLNATIRLQSLLLKKPEAILEDSNDHRWKWFKGCLGALDGTHIRVQVLAAHKGRYRNRKGDITTNVLGVCSPDGQFIFVFPEWEGSAADGRVLRDATTRPHGLRVPLGNYYLVDAGYSNCQGFLAPYRGQRYHLNDWRQGHQPQTAHECFNMRHSAARNVIERCFGILKLRWAILRSPSFYPVRLQNRYIVACCLLHNLIRREGVQDPLDEQLESFDIEPATDENMPIVPLETTDVWTNYREQIANEMFADFVAQR